MVHGTASCGSDRIVPLIGDGQGGSEVRKGALERGALPVLAASHGYAGLAVSGLLLPEMAEQDWTRWSRPSCASACRSRVMDNEWASPDDHSRIGCPALRWPSVGALYQRCSAAAVAITEKRARQDLRVEEVFQAVDTGPDLLLRRVYGPSRSVWSALRPHRARSIECRSVFASPVASTAAWRSVSSVGDHLWSANEVGDRTHHAVHGQHVEHVRVEDDPHAMSRVA